MGANTDITDMVEMYRETLREAGMPQPPAPTEKIEAIQCPVNIRKESLVLSSKTNSIQCNIDIDVSAIIEIRLKRKDEILAHKSQEVQKVGIKQSLEIPLESHR